MTKIDDLMDRFGAKVKNANAPADFDAKVSRAAASVTVKKVKPVEPKEPKQIVRILQYSASALSVILILTAMVFIFPHNKTPSVSNTDNDQSIFTYNTPYYYLGEIEWALFDSPQQLYDRSDLVLIVSPTIDYMDTTPMAPFDQVIDRDRQSEVIKFHTLRNFDVIQVLKGENVPANLNAAESFGINNKLSSEGKTQILLIYDYVIPMRSGMKYVVFLSRLTSGQYSITALQGKYNIDGKDIDERNIKGGWSSSFQDFKYRVLNFIAPLTTIPIVNNGVPDPAPTPSSINSNN